MAKMLKCCRLLLLCLFVPTIESRSNFRSYTTDDLKALRDRVSAMFHHAYDGYLKYAYPYDELRPLSCDGVDTWGSYSLTLIDALDTLAIMGNFTEFRRVYNLIAKDRRDFDANINVSVFETNIRIVGGLLSAHLLAHRAGVDLEPGWPCSGPLLRLAEDAATRLLPAFDTPTGMPYGTVNLRNGVPVGETPITCTAGVGTFVVEFGALSRLTGNLIFEKTALRAMDALWHYRSSIGLLGNHIDVQTGKWTATDAGIGAGVDSYYEYLVKGSMLLQRPELMHMFKESRQSIEQFLNHDDWHFWVTMKQGTVTMPVFQSLEAFWPGILSLTGDNIGGLKSIHNYHQVWKQYGFLPEFYNVAQNMAAVKREGYPLRPELVESAMYLYRATKDPFLVNLGEDMLESIEFSAKTVCGYATVKDVRDHTLEDRMESFFLSETTKYLYLLFDTDNFIHNSGAKATLVNTPRGQCVIDAGGYIFNTEAHPIDPATLECCTGPTEDELAEHLLAKLRGSIDPEFQGDTISARLQEIETRQREDAEKRRLMELEVQRWANERHQKEREALKRKMELEEIRKQNKALEESEDFLHEENLTSSQPDEIVLIQEVLEGTAEQSAETDPSTKTDPSASTTPNIETQSSTESNPSSTAKSNIETQSNTASDPSATEKSNIESNASIKPSTTIETSTSTKPSSVTELNSANGPNNANEKTATLKPDTVSEHEVQHTIGNSDLAQKEIESTQIENGPNSKVGSIELEIPDVDPASRHEEEENSEDGNSFEKLTTDLSDFNEENMEQNLGLEEPDFSSVSSTDNRIESSSDEPLLIKRQSKDEATEKLNPSKNIFEKVVENHLPKDPLDVLEALNTIIKQYLPLRNKDISKFDIDEYRSKLFLDNQYVINKTWSKDHSVMVCPARLFLERFSVQGEFFENYN